MASQSFSINGVVCPEVSHWTGGDAQAAVVIEPASPDTNTKKHVGSISYNAITVQATLPLSPPLLACVADLCANHVAPVPLLLSNLDYTGAAVGNQLQATNALLMEVQFPALDAADRGVVQVVLIFQPQRVQPATPGTACAPHAGAARTGVALNSNFHLNLAGLDTSQIRRIEPFTIRRAQPEMAIGQTRDPSANPGATEFSNLVLTFAGALAPADWTAWHDDFVLQGHNSDTQEKDGSLQFLATNLQTALFALKFSHVGIMRLSFQPQANAQTGATQAELYCETMGVDGNPVTPAATTTPAPASTTPADSTAAAAPAPTTTPTPATTAEPPTPTPAATPASVIPPSVIAGTDRTVLPATPARTALLAPNTLSPAATTAIPTALSPAAPATRSGPAAATNPEDKGMRDPANFPRADGTVRTGYNGVRQKGFSQETATYTATTSADSIMAYYEKALGGDGWEESARYENNNGANNAHQITSIWKKETRTASFTLVDVATNNVQIQVTVEARQ